MIEAFRELSKGWNVNIARAFAQGTTFIDITAGTTNPDEVINKRTSARMVKNYAQGLYRIYMREENELAEDNTPQIPKIFTMAIGDAPAPPDQRDSSTNDAPFLLHTGGITNTQSFERHKLNGWPIHLQDVYGPFDLMTTTNLFLRDLVIGRVPENERQDQYHALLRLLGTLQEERKQQYASVDN